MRAAEQIQLASLRHLFYLVGYGRIVGYSEAKHLGTAALHHQTSNPKSLTEALGGTQPPYPTPNPVHLQTTSKMHRFVASPPTVLDMSSHCL